MAYCINYKGHKPFSLLHQRGHHPFSPFSTVSTLSSFSLLLSFSLPLPLTKTISYLRLDRTFSCFFIMLVPILQEVNVYFLGQKCGLFPLYSVRGNTAPLSLSVFCFFLVISIINCFVWIYYFWELWCISLDAINVLS